MRPYLLIDFGSTYTKVTAVDAERRALLGQAQAPTTAATELTLGLRSALHRLRERLGGLPRFRARLASSSAAGGLRLAAVGLVPDLTAKAAQQAALGAGARVIAIYAFRLGEADLADLERRQPDIVLLAGGTDGGNGDIVLHNAHMLAASRLAAPVVYAGNAAVREAVVALFRRAGKLVRAVDNVMPRLYELRVEAARQAIRDLFLERIVAAKGLDRVLAMLDGIVMPTPAAVLKATELLAGGWGSQPGFGPTAVIDIGGATTDVHSVSPPGALEPAVISKGLAEPYAKRTVEGDLGMRVSAPALLEAVGIARWRAAVARVAAGLGMDREVDADALVARVERLGRDPEYLPSDGEDEIVEQALGRLAAGEAMRRHAGRMREVQMPDGRRYHQYGKDLRPLRLVVGTGGVFIHSRRPDQLFAEVAYDGSEPDVLRPRAPRWAIDARYLLAPLGLLADREPEAAFTLLAQHLVTVMGPSGRREDGNDA